MLCDFVGVCGGCGGVLCGVKGGGGWGGGGHPDPGWRVCLSEVGWYPYVVI